MFVACIGPKSIKYSSLAIHVRMQSGMQWFCTQVVPQNTPSRKKTSTSDRHIPQMQLHRTSENDTKIGTIANVQVQDTPKQILFPGLRNPKPPCSPKSPNN
eukprot:880299-Amphidinium_carterae.1